MCSPVHKLSISHQSPTGHSASIIIRRPSDSSVSSPISNHPVPVSANATPSSAITACLDNHPADVMINPSAAPGLENVFAETVPLDSNNEERVEFSYGPETLLCPLLPSASPHGFPGNALVFLLSHHWFGFTRDFLHNAGAHFKTHVMKLWDTFLCVGFMPSHHHPTTSLPAHTVVQTDGDPPLTPISEVSSGLEMASAHDGPRTILHHHPPIVSPADADPYTPSVHQHSGCVTMAPSGSDACDCASSSRDDPPWDSRENLQDPNFHVDPHTGTV